jgi:hypothetical protein
LFPRSGEGEAMAGERLGPLKMAWMLWGNTAVSSGRVRLAVASRLPSTAALTLLPSTLKVTVPWWTTPPEPAT